MLTVKGQVMTASDQVEMPLIRTGHGGNREQGKEEKKKQKLCNLNHFHQLFLSYPMILRTL